MSKPWPILPQGTHIRVLATGETHVVEFSQDYGIVTFHGPVLLRDKGDQWELVGGEAEAA